MEPAAGTKWILAHPVVAVAAAGAVCVSWSPLVQYLAVAPFGSKLFLSLQLLVVGPFLAAVIALAATPFLLFSRRWRPFALRIFVVACVLAVAVPVGVKLGHRTRMAAFERLAARSAPLVEAIRAYEAHHGKPPSDLADLAPEYFTAVPHTGMRAYPDYDYLVGEAATRHEGNPWALVVRTTSGGINFDQFMYLPLQNYPKTGYGGVLERVSDWAYVHE